MDIESEILLTKDEIMAIENFADIHINLRNEFVSGFSINHTSVLKISSIKGLIFVKGNDHTGFEHIHSRHEFWSNKPFWVEQKDFETRLDNPSKFKKNSKTVFDYVKIVDVIYDAKNLNYTKNKRPEIFDYYTAEYTHEDNTKDFYVLLTYKNSKVVHTLYPKSKKNNIRKSEKLKLHRGDTSIEEIPKKETIEIKVPYKNSNDITEYSIFIRKSTRLNIEKSFILLHDKIGEPSGFVYLGERASKQFDSLVKLQMSFQYSDLRGFERHILRLINLNEK